MDIASLKKSDKKEEKVQKEQKKRISISRVFYEQLKTEADKRKMKIPEFIAFIFSDFLNRKKEEQKQADDNNLQATIKHDKNIVPFEMISSENIQEDSGKEKEQVSEKSSILGVVDIEERLLEKAGNELETALGTSDEEHCIQEYRRLLREQKRKEYNYHGKK